MPHGHQVWYLVPLLGLEWWANIPHAEGMSLPEPDRKNINKQSFSGRQSGHKILSAEREAMTNSVGHSLLQGECQCDLQFGGFVREDICQGHPGGTGG